MNDIVKFENLKNLIVELRGESVLLDSDVAQIYGVSTRDINKAVTNNPDKFPAGYVVELSKPEKSELVENFHRFNKLKHSTVNPKAFPKKACTCWLLSLKVRRQFKLLWQSLKLSQKSDTYQETFKNYQLLKMTMIRRRSCRKAEK